MTDAASIAQRLGGRKSADGYLCRCPLQSHGQGRGDRHPSLLIKDGNDTVLLKCFAGCEAKDILGELRGRGILGEERAGERVPRDVRPADRPPDHTPNFGALELWHGAGPVAADTKPAQFLRARGLMLAAPPSLRSTSLLHLDRYPLPAMIAAVQAPDRRIIAVQVTLIDPRRDRKAQVRIPRWTMGALGWGAIRLAAATETLGLTEGTEKGLAAMQLFGVPCWSSLGAARMHRVWIPEQVRELHIFVDNDDAGRAAAGRTAHEHRHRKVVMRFPPEQFKDWDDVTRARSSERSAA
jgi:putative DNA primase/helicase